MAQSQSDWDHVQYSYSADTAYVQSVASRDVVSNMVGNIILMLNLLMIRGFEFISLEIDGVTETDFFCSFEGLYYYAVYLVEIMWGLIWLYDFILTLEKPNLYTGKYLMYYCVCAYFIAFGFSVCSYF
jgi:hypothetical protein